MRGNWVDQECYLSHSFQNAACGAGVEDGVDSESFGRLLGGDGRHHFV